LDVDEEPEDFFGKKTPPASGMMMGMRTLDVDEEPEDFFGKKTPPASGMMMSMRIRA
jgi:hypothetical protein